jgi:hypothetical protein
LALSIWGQLAIPNKLSHYFDSSLLKDEKGRTEMLQAWEGDVRQLLSLYFRFYKMNMLESTNVTDEGKMQVYFEMLDCVHS